MTMLWALIFLLVFHCNNAEKQDCPPSSCGSLPNITYPFRLKEDPKICGRPETDFEIACESNQATLYHNSRRYYVKEIIYENHIRESYTGPYTTIRVVDSALRVDDCSSLPLYDDSSYYGELWPLSTDQIVFVNCSVPVDDPSYVATAPCIRSSPQSYLYALKVDMKLSDLNTSCKVAAKVYVEFSEIFRYPANYSEIHHQMMMGFDLYWSEYDNCYRSIWNVKYNADYILNILSKWRECSSCKRLFQSFRCFFKTVGILLKAIAFYILYAEYFGFGSHHHLYGYYEMFLIVRTAVGILCLSIFLVYKLRRKHIWMDTTVEEFLCKYKYQVPRRYSHSEIKKMTKNFKEKLGQGGYGSVFKGKLSSGRLVAIKMLKKSKGNGQEFINEIATIGRIHHVNVVRLLGFCSEGSKRALIYEFMPNGSLEKHIFTKEKRDLLCWNKMYQIAIGIARGIGYLHQGCDMRILHFDIKPHNILLDEKFIPKVSDFGLAKFYPTDESIVSVTAARGTFGYIAPELVYKNVGGVSYKSDVYSFGMLLMEMAGRRKNIDAFAGNSSQVYFPLWIYDQLDQGKDMIMEDASENDQEIAKKLIMVALWCIQIKPTDRPSMSKVVKMLEGSVENLKLPVKPFISFSEHSLDQDRNSNTNIAESSATNRSGSISQNFVELNVLDVLVD